MEGGNKMIRITENCRIKTADKLNFTVQEKKINDKKDSKNYGEEYWVNIPACYCGSLERACLRILEYKIMTDEEERNIKSLIDYMGFCKNEVVQGVRNLGEMMNNC